MKHVSVHDLWMLARLSIGRNNALNSSTTKGPKVHKRFDAERESCFAEGCCSMRTNSPISPITPTGDILDFHETRNHDIP